MPGLGSEIGVPRIHFLAMIPAQDIRLLLKRSRDKNLPLSRFY